MIVSENPFLKLLDGHLVAPNRIFRACKASLVDHFYSQDKLFHIVRSEARNYCMITAERAPYKLEGGVTLHAHKGHVEFSDFGSAINSHFSYYNPIIDQIIIHALNNRVPLVRGVFEPNELSEVGIEALTGYGFKTSKWGKDKSYRYEVTDHYRADNGEILRFYSLDTKRLTVEKLYEGENKICVQLKHRAKLLVSLRLTFSFHEVTRVTGGTQVIPYLGAKTVLEIDSLLPEWDNNYYLTPVVFSAVLEALNSFQDEIVFHIQGKQSSALIDILKSFRAYDLGTQIRLDLPS